MRNHARETFQSARRKLDSSLYKLKNIVPVVCNTHSELLFDKIHVPENTVTIFFAPPFTFSCETHFQNNAHMYKDISLESFQTIPMNITYPSNMVELICLFMSHLSKSFTGNETKETLYDICKSVGKRIDKFYRIRPDVRVAGDAIFDQSINFGDTSSFSTGLFDPIEFFDTTIDEQYVCGMEVNDNDRYTIEHRQFTNEDIKRLSDLYKFLDSSFSKSKYPDKLRLLFFIGCRNADFLGNNYRLPLKPQMQGIQEMYECYAFCVSSFNDMTFNFHVAFGDHYLDLSSEEKRKSFESGDLDACIFRLPEPCYFYNYSFYSLDNEMENKNLLFYNQDWPDFERNEIFSNHLIWEPKNRLGEKKPFIVVLYKLLLENMSDEYKGMHICDYLKSQFESYINKDSQYSQSKQRETENTNQENKQIETEKSNPENKQRETEQEEINQNEKEIPSFSYRQYRDISKGNNRKNNFFNWLFGFSNVNDSENISI